MDRISETVMGQYLALLEEQGVAGACRPDFMKWLRYYLDFCAKYAITGSGSERSRLFLAKLREKNQTADQRRQAAHAVSLYLEMQGETAPFASSTDAQLPQKETASAPPLPCFPG